MKINLNLSAAMGPRDRFALMWAIPATLVGLVALVLLCRASFREYRQDQGIQQQLAEVRGRVTELRDQEAVARRKLESPEYGELLQRAQFVNSLIDQKEFSASDLMARIAGLLPEDAHLTGLALMSPRKPGEDYAVRLGITAKGEEAVQTLLNDLEDSPDFKDVSIQNEGFTEEAAQAQQVNLICTARYLPGAEKKWEEENAQSAPASTAAGGKQPVAGGKSQAAGAGVPAPGVKTHPKPGKTAKPDAGSQKVAKPRAEKPTPNRKPNP